MIEFDRETGRPAVARLCESKFSIAYELYRHDTGAMASHMSISGPMEIILLDADPLVQHSDSRFLLCGGGLDWAGFEHTIGEDTYDVQFLLTEFLSNPYDTRPIETLTPDDLQFVQIYMVSKDSSVVSTDFGPLDEVSLGELFSKLNPTRVVDHLPEWVRG